MATITLRSAKGSPLTNAEVDDNFSNLNTELGQKESASNKGQASGYASLDGSGKVPASQLPSYVDDVVEAANFLSLPGTGETGKIYVTLDTNKTYRWSGSAYVEISASPGSTDAVTEGSTNLYFTNARARAAVSASGSLSYNTSTGIFSYTQPTNVSTFTNDSGYLTGITGAQVTTALGFTPYNATNPSGYITGITSGMVTTALGYTPYNSSNPSGYITSSSNITGNAATATTASQLNGYFSSSYSGPTSAVKQFFWDNLSASGTQARTFEIARLGIDYNDWNGGSGPFEVELYEAYYSRGLKKKYVISWGYTNSSSIQLVEYSGSGDNNFQVRIGTPVLVSGDNYYLPVFVDVKYYAGVDVVVTTNRDITSSNPPAIGTTFINASPSATNISDFTADSTVNFASTTAVQINGNQLLHAGNYTSYSPSLTGSGASGTWGISVTGSAGSIANNSVTDYFRITNTGGGQRLLLGNQDSAGVNNPAVITSANGIIWFGNGNTWSGSGGTVTNYVTFSSSSVSFTAPLQQSGNQVLHTANYSSYALPLSGGTLTGALNFASIDQGAVLQHNGNGAAWYGRILTKNATNDRAAFLGTYAGIAGVFAHNNALNAWADLYVNTVNGSDGGTVRMPSSVLVNGNQVLHAGNYTSYSPSLTGSGASGTWGINITGNAATLGGNAASYYDHRAYNVANNYLGAYYVGSGTEKPNDTIFGAGKLKLAMLSGGNLGFGGSWNDVLWMSSYTGGDVKPSYAIVGDKYSDELWFSRQNYDSATWGTGRRILHSGNYTSYSPSLTGSGASGTWGIRITGFANQGSPRLYSTDGSYNYDAANPYFGYLTYDGSRWLFQVSPATPAAVRVAYADSAGSASNSSTVGGLSVHGGTNNEANKIVRTDGNGYIQAGWINTISGNLGSGSRLNRVWCSDDQYMRYLSLAEFKMQMGLSAKNTFQRHADYTGDSNYWVGSFGGSGMGANEVFHGGSGFVDFWGGTNFPPNTSHVMGFNALHYTVNSFGSTGGNAYGIQVVGQYNQGGLLFSRACSGGSFSAWRTQLDDNNYSSYALPLSGGTTTGRITMPAWTTSGRNYSNEWIEFGNYSGLYSPLNGAHFYPNNTEYGSWRIAGSRAGWHGIYFDSGANLMMNSSEVGFHRAGYGWMMWWSGGTGYVHKGNPGGGTQATILDSSNYTSYSPSLGGSGASGSWNITAARATRANGNFYIDDNYGNGVVGVYASTRYQGVFAMGDSYKLPADGTSTGSLYGMAWSHPNAGGVAGNLDSHGMLVLINGGFGSCMSYSIRASGNVTAYSDERLKTNWREMPENYVERLAQVKVGIYDRIDGEKITQVGIGAQSFQRLLPEAITKATDEMGTLSVSYGNAAMASAVELAKELVMLKKELAEIKSRLH